MLFPLKINCLNILFYLKCVCNKYAIIINLSYSLRNGQVITSKKVCLILWKINTLDITENQPVLYYFVKY